MPFFHRFRVIFRPEMSPPWFLYQCSERGGEQESARWVGGRGVDAGPCEGRRQRCFVAGSLGPRGRHPLGHRRAQLPPPRVLRSDQCCGVALHPFMIQFWIVCIGHLTILRPNLTGAGSSPRLAMRRVFFALHPSSAPTSSAVRSSRSGLWPRLDRSVPQVVAGIS